MPYHAGEVEELLRKLKPGEVGRDALLGPLTSYGIGGPADFLVHPASESALGELLDGLDELGVRPFVLGNGSNLLVSDLGCRGVVVRLKKLRTELELEGDVLRVGAGAAIWDLTPFAAARGLVGFEPISGIPGSLGGALAMNAGAFGGAVSDKLIEIDLMELDGTRRTVPARAVDFGYRSAPQLQEMVLLAAVFDASERGDPERIGAACREIMARRETMQPLEHPSCGSVFKRPAGHYAGKLMQDAGMKGFRIGGAQVAEKHANFILNLGGATAADIMSIIAEARRRVYHNSGVRLETELRFLGDFSYVEG